MRARIILAIFLTSSFSSAQIRQPKSETTFLPPQLSLSQAEEILFQRNLVIAASRQQVEIADALRRIAGLKPNPTLQFGAEQIPFVSPVPGSVPRLFATNPDAGANPVYTAQFGRVIERGGKRKLRSEQAGALLDAAKAQVLDTFRQQLIQLRQAFTNALLAKQNLKLAAETERQYQETERIMNIRLRAGDIAVVDLERVRIAKLPFQQAVIDARTAYGQVIRDVLNLLGIGDRSPMPITSSGPSEILPEIVGELDPPELLLTADQLKDTARQERPDLQAARGTLRATERGTRLAEAQRTRDIYTAVEYQRVGSDHSVGAIVSFPLFLYNNQKAAIEQATAQERLAEVQVRQAELQVLTEVDKTYQAFLSARQSLNLYSADTLNRANRIRETVNYSYQRGEADLLEVLEAQRSSAQVLLLYNQARANYMNAYWQLQSAVGRTF